MFQVGFWWYKKQIWSTHWVYWEEGLKYNDNLKMKTTSKEKTTSKMKTSSKIGLSLPNFFVPPLPIKSYWTFFWWLLTLTATHQLMSNRICYQVSEPEMEFPMIDIIYTALPMHAQTEKTTFSCKDNCTLTKHKRHWTYSALQYFSPKKWPHSGSSQSGT